MDELRGVLSQGPAVDRLTAAFEQQQLIKGLKDVNRRLVDGAHCMAVCDSDAQDSMMT